MNQKGELTLFSILALLCLSALLTLMGLKLQHSYHLLKKRSELYLCTKELKGELGDYLKFMGRTNWGIANAKRASLLLAFIPGLQAGALKAQKVKKTLIQLQNLRLVSYSKKLIELKSRSCPLDPRLATTPFHLQGLGYQRDSSDRAKLRSKTWSHLFVSSPYFLELQVEASAYESLSPKIRWSSRESGEKFSSLFFSLY